METTLIDDTGITWIRRHCRCCRAVLWEVLGDTAGLCRNCAAAPVQSMRILLFYRDTEYLHRLHALQYHGACAVDV